MDFLIEDDDLLEKYNAIWEVSADIKINLIASLFPIKFFQKNQNQISRQ